MTTSALLQVLGNDVFPSLGVRQFVFFQIVNGRLVELLSREVESGQLPGDQDLPLLLAQAGKLLPNSTDGHSSHSWIRLILPLRMGDDLTGLWLLGRRTTEEPYSAVDQSILQAAANQTAVTLCSLLRTERLRAIYAVNIERYEQEKKRLALDLHDQVLSEMASLLINYDFSSVSPRFSDAYHELVDRLRGIIGAFRPLMLNFGLKFALEDIADQFSERPAETTKLTMDIQTDGEWSYPGTIESHLYRIVQEAFENALRHAHARVIRITCGLYRHRVEITVQDNGVGFVHQVDELITRGRFGLADMFERAKLIGAEIKIDSHPGRGTRIHILWNSP